MKKYTSILILAFILLICVPKPTFSQCAMCRRIAETNMENKSNNIGKGLNKGILYMLCFPYLIGAAGGIIWYRNKKKNNKTEDSSSISDN